MVVEAKSAPLSSSHFFLYQQRATDNLNNALHGDLHDECCGTYRITQMCIVVVIDLPWVVSESAVPLLRQKAPQ